MADTMTRGQIQDLVGKFASENPKYRAALLSNPKATIEKQLNTQLGATTVKAVADTGDDRERRFAHLGTVGRDDRLAAGTHERRRDAPQVSPAVIREYDSHLRLPLSST